MNIHRKTLFTILAGVTLIGTVLLVAQPSSVYAAARDITATMDTDQDGLTDVRETRRYHTNPLRKDTDRDRLTDHQEIRAYNTNPTISDTDTDGLADGAEVKVHGTDPLNMDTDGDTLTDGDEINTYGTDPLVAEPRYGIAACTSSTEPQGSLLWDIDLNSSISSPPVFEGEMAWVGSINGDTMFYAVRDDGTVTASADIKYGVEQSAMAIPDALDPTVLRIVTNTINMSSAEGSGGNRITGTLSDGSTNASQGKGFQILNASSLAYEDGYTGPGADGSPGFSPDGAIYFGSIDRIDVPEFSRHSFNTETNEIEKDWTVNSPGWAYSAPTIDPAGNSYIGFEVTDGSAEQQVTGRMPGRLMSFTPDGVERWRAEAKCEASGGPILYQEDRDNDGVEEFSVVSQDRCGVLSKYAAEDGTLLWQYDLGTFSLSAPVMGANNELVLASSGVKIPNTNPPYEKMLVAFNANTGAIEWAYSFENQDTPAIVGDGAIYLVGQDGEVISLDDNGNENWTYQTGYPMHRGFAGLNECGMLQFGTDDGHYLAFSTESTGLDTTSDYPTYRGDYHRTGQMFAE